MNKENNKSLSDVTPEEWTTSNNAYWANKTKKETITESQMAITHPPHYTKGRQFEPWDVIDDWQLNYFTATALKYISRYERKGEPIVDLQKAIKFLEKEIERLQRRT